jgi:hypothetical protein
MIRFKNSFWCRLRLPRQLMQCQFFDFINNILISSVTLLWHVIFSVTCRPAMIDWSMTWLLSCFKFWPNFLLIQLTTTFSLSSFKVCLLFFNQRENNLKQGCSTIRRRKIIVLRNFTMNERPYTSIPSLPVELEREIFESAARDSRQTAFTLLRVAHRVRIWWVPILTSSSDPLPIWPRRG